MVSFYEGTIDESQPYPAGNNTRVRLTVAQSGNGQSIELFHRDRIPCTSPLVRYRVAVKPETGTIVYVDRMCVLNNSGDPDADVNELTLELLCAGEANSAKVWLRAAAKAHVRQKDTLDAAKRDAIASHMPPAEAVYFRKLVSDEFLAFYASLSCTARLLDAMHWHGSALALCYRAADLLAEFDSPSDYWRLAFTSHGFDEPDVEQIDWHSKQRRAGRPEWLTRELYKAYKTFCTTLRVNGDLCAPIKSADAPLLAQYVRVVRQVAPLDATGRVAYYTRPAYDDAIVRMREMLRQRQRVEVVCVAQPNDFAAYRKLLDASGADDRLVYCDHYYAARELTEQLGVVVKPFFWGSSTARSSVVWILNAHNIGTLDLARVVETHYTACKRVVLVGSPVLPPPDYIDGQLFSDIVTLHAQTPAQPLTGPAASLMHTLYDIRRRADWCDAVFSLSRMQVTKDLCVQCGAVDDLDDTRPIVSDERTIFLCSTERAATIRMMNWLPGKHTWVLVEPSAAINAHIGRLTAPPSLGDGGAVFYKLDTPPPSFDGGCAYAECRCGTAGDFHMNASIHAIKYMHALPVSAIPNTLRVDRVELELDPATSCWSDVFRALCCARRELLMSVRGAYDDEHAKRLLMEILARHNVRRNHITDVTLWDSTTVDDSEQEQDARLVATYRSCVGDLSDMVNDDASNADDESSLASSSSSVSD